MTNYPGNRVPHKMPLAERLAYHSIPEPNSGCQLWLSYVNKDGYGTITFNNQRLLAHVAAYSVHRGDPGEFCVCHKCDVPACINPAHLFLGTQGENTLDKITKGRHPRGVRVWNAKLTAEDALVIRRSATPPTKMAKEYGISPALVCHIRSGKAWKHI